MHKNVCTTEDLHTSTTININSYIQLKCRKQVTIVMGYLIHTE